jgi:hypothetical protein
MKGLDAETAVIGSREGRGDDRVDGLEDVGDFWELDLNKDNRRFRRGRIEADMDAILCVSPNRIGQCCVVCLSQIKVVMMISLTVSFPHRVKRRQGHILKKQPHLRLLYHTIPLTAKHEIIF